MILKLSAVSGDKEPQVTLDVPDHEFATLEFSELAKRYLEPAVSMLRNAIVVYDISTDTHKPVRDEEVVQSAASAAAVPTQMAFNQALEEAKAGKKITRTAWPTGPNGASPVWLEFDPRMLPHLKFMPVAGIWQHSKEDMTARDWVVVA